MNAPQVSTTSLHGERRIFVFELEAAVWRIEGVQLVIRASGDTRLTIPEGAGAAYLPMKGHKLVRPAKPAVNEADFARRLRTIANRVSNLIPDYSFILHDPSHPKGWPGHVEIYPKRTHPTDGAYRAPVIRTPGLQ